MADSDGDVSLVADVDEADVSLAFEVGEFVEVEVLKSNWVKCCIASVAASDPAATYGYDVFVFPTASFDNAGGQSGKIMPGVQLERLRRPGGNVHQKYSQSAGSFKVLDEQNGSSRTIETVPSSTAVGRCRFETCRSVLLTIVFLIAYFGLGTIVYVNVEDWTTVEAIYFCSVTMSTVGYGDFSPSYPGTQVFTIFMIFGGIIFVFSRLAEIVSIVTSPITRTGRVALEYLFPQQLIDIDGDGQHDFKKIRHPVIYYGKNLIPSAFLNITVQMLSAAVFIAVEPEWDYGTALYHCIVTATTVGYGDVSIETDAGRIWACVQILLSVAMLGELVGTVGELQTEREALLRKERQLMHTLDGDFLERLLHRAREMRPDVERDGEGLTEMEFVLGSIVELGKVDWHEVHPFISQFRTLDQDGNRRLAAKDLEIIIKRRAVELCDQVLDGEESIATKTQLQAHKKPESLAASQSPGATNVSL